MSVGVIVAVQASTSMQQAESMREELEGRFPGVVFAIIAGGTSSVAFEWTVPVKAYDGPPIVFEPDWTNASTRRRKRTKRGAP